MIVDKNTILDYFNEYIFGFMYADTENCIKAKANFAVAQLLMTYTENIGSLIEGNLGLTGKSEVDFNKALEYFEFNGDVNYYNNIEISFKENLSSSELKKLGIYKAFRCGLVHEYFPKLPCVVHNNPDDINHFINKDAGIGWIKHEGKDVLRFHTNAYFRDFKKAIDKIYHQIFVQNDPGITVKVEKSLERIYSRVLVK